jgi:hypothetical protein
MATKGLCNTQTTIWRQYVKAWQRPDKNKQRNKRAYDVTGASLEVPVAQA